MQRGLQLLLHRVGLPLALRAAASPLCACSVMSLPALREAWCLCRRLTAPLLAYAGASSSFGVPSACSATWCPPCGSWASVCWHTRLSVAACWWGGAARRCWLRLLLAPVPGLERIDLLLGSPQTGAALRAFTATAMLDANRPLIVLGAALADVPSLQAGRFSGVDELGEKDFRRWGQPRFQGEAFEANKVRGSFRS